MGEQLASGRRVSLTIPLDQLRHRTGVQVYPLNSPLLSRAPVDFLEESGTRTARDEDWDYFQRYLRYVREAPGFRQTR